LKKEQSMKKLMIPLTILFLIASPFAFATNQPAEQDIFKKLFDSQIITLKNKGVPTRIVNMLERQRDAVIKKASEMTFKAGHISFLPVISRTDLTIKTQMKMIVTGGRKGYAGLTHLITDVIKTPDKPYYIYDVEDGKATLGKSSRDAMKLIKNVGRHALTVVEIISLSLHTNVLSRHFVHATGSRYISADFVPFVWLFGGGPRLSWDDADYPYSRWGSPSLVSRGL